MSFDRTRALLGLPVAALLACSGDESVGSSGTYTSASTTSASTTTDSTASSSSSSSSSSGASETDTSTGSTSTSSTTGVVDPLLVDCGDPPKGAEGANYQHTPSASGGVPGYTWSASGLADGLSINEFTGVISGTPTVAGLYTFELSVTDTKGTMAMTTCPSIEVAAGLSIDLGGIDAPCISGDGSLLDYVKGGDGSAIACSAPGGTGNGKLPAGLGVDADTCKIVGSMEETRYGTWVWMVRAVQNGAEAWVPYCATQSQQAPKAYKIAGTHSGGKDQLAPAVGSFKDGAALLFDGDGEPKFEVTTTCGNTCFYSFYYSVSASPFGGGECLADKDGCFGLCPLVPDMNEPDGDTQTKCTLLPEMGLPKEGFRHEMWAKGAPAADAYKGRPWVLQYSIDYCISTSDTACVGKDNILKNGGGSNLEFAVIMQPSG